MKPKVIINGIPLLSPFTGIGRYIYEISRELKQNDSLNIDFYYGYCSKKLAEPDSRSKVKTLKNIIAEKPILKRIFRKVLRLYGALFSDNYDLYWEPNFIPYSNIESNKVITSIHDFSFILYEDFHPRERIEYFEKNFFKNIKSSNAIICFSEFTKREILERLHFGEEKVFVIYHGIDHKLFKVNTQKNANIQLPEKFILCVGSVEPRKNLIGLLKAYEILNDELKKNYHLVLAGFKGWNNTEIMSIIEQNKEYIHYLGYLSDDELVEVYNRSSLFVYPSFYEGFGLPPLEAMACGTPVITSNVSSMPEVCGDAALYCDPYNIDDIKEKIETLLENEALRAELRQKGLERAKLFTWKKAAAAHMRIFEEVLGR